MAQGQGLPRSSYMKTHYKRSAPPRLVWPTRHLCRTAPLRWVPLQGNKPYRYTRISVLGLACPSVVAFSTRSVPISIPMHAAPPVFQGAAPTEVTCAPISSHCNPRRKHPILYRVRAHRGVGYAAPMGTPGHATGDNRIRFIGDTGQYGRTILIRPARGYETLHTHLSGYAQGLQKEQRVAQRQRIAHVGKSRLATAAQR